MDLSASQPTSTLVATGESQMTEQSFDSSKGETEAEESNQETEAEANATAASQESPEAEIAKSGSPAGGVPAADAVEQQPQKPATPYNTFLKTLKDPACESTVESMRNFTVSFPQSVRVRADVAPRIHDFFNKI
eukprot:Selendium_serpulae@DN5527_c0_g1_i9.p1